jgi:SAM-dependent methyltransferase
MADPQARRTLSGRLASALRDARNSANGIRRLERYWECLGRDNPMTAVLTRPEEWEEQEFFATGVSEVADVIAYVESLDVPVGRGRALDFGCGLGRLSRPLAQHFDRVVGVDIAESMIEAAERLNASIDNCEFVHNSRPDLAVFESGSFDFVYSNIVLQHMAPALAKGYIREFVRVLSDRGLLLFQLPGGKTSDETPGAVEVERGKIRVQNVLRPAVEMYYVPRADVIDTVTSAGGRVLAVQDDDFAGPGFKSYRYTVVRA